MESEARSIPWPSAELGSPLGDVGRSEEETRGERQTPAIATSLIARPRLLLLDEPSTGLAPALVERVMESIVDINQRLGTTILLVEQNVSRALAAAEKVYVLRLGEVIAEEPAAALQSSERLWALV